MKALARYFIAATVTMRVGTATASTVELTDEQVENLVERSYQYVAMYKREQQVCAEAARLEWL